MTTTDRFPKLDIDALYDESEKRGLYDVCRICEEGPHVICWLCHVCFKYCHDDWFHEMDYSSGGVGQP